MIPSSFDLLPFIDYSKINRYKYSIDSPNPLIHFFQWTENNHRNIIRIDKHQSLIDESISIISTLGRLKEGQQWFVIVPHSWCLNTSITTSNQSARKAIPDKQKYLIPTFVVNDSTNIIGTSLLNDWGIITKNEIAIEEDKDFIGYIPMFDGNIEMSKYKFPKGIYRMNLRSMEHILSDIGQYHSKSAIIKITL